MVELKGGSKLIRVDPTVVQGYNVKILKDENTKLKNKIVSLKEDFQRIINEVQTLQYYVVEHENKTKDKFRKIKIIVSTLKKEREFLYAQNQKYCNELKSLVEENDSLRQLLGQGEMEKKAGHECSEKKEETKEEAKQSTYEKKEKTKNEKILKVRIPTTPFNNTLNEKNLLASHEVTKENVINHKEEVEKVPLQIMESIQTERTEIYKTPKKSKSYKLKCKKIIHKKKTRCSSKCVFFMREKTRILWSILKCLQNDKNIPNLFSRFKGLDKSILKRNIIKEDSFFQCRYSKQAKRNMQLKQNNYNFFSVLDIRKKARENMLGIAKMEEMYFACTNETEERRQENETDRCLVLSSRQKEKESAMEEEQIKPHEKNDGTNRMRTVVSIDAVTEEKKINKKNDLILSEFSNNDEEWNEEQKKTSYLLDIILRICEKFRKEDFEKINNEIKKYVPNTNIFFEKENHFYFKGEKKFLDKKKFFGTLSPCIDLIANQIVSQDEKINEFEMKINNINIFSHNLLAILKEKFHRKIKKEKQYNNILVVIQNIINECQLKKEIF